MGKRDHSRVGVLDLISKDDAPEARISHFVRRLRIARRRHLTAEALVVHIRAVYETRLH
jgi:hypothetical protein